MTKSKQTNCECGAPLSNEYELEWGMCEPCYDNVGDWEDEAQRRADGISRVGVSSYEGDGMI